MKLLNSLIFRNAFEYLVNKATNMTLTVYGVSFDHPHHQNKHLTILNYHSPHQNNHNIFTRTEERTSQWSLERKLHGKGKPG